MRRVKNPSLKGMFGVAVAGGIGLLTASLLSKKQTNTTQPPPPPPYPTTPTVTLGQPTVSQQ